MSQPPSERDRGGDEDLFEDLDQFFAPLEESAWTDDDRAREEGTPAPPPAPTGAPGEGLEDLESLSIEIPEEEELLGPPPPPTPGRPESPATADERREEDALGLFEEEAPGGPEAPATGVEEGTEVAEWDALRADRKRAAPAEEGRGEEETPLSVDDLRAAPPEYAGLPGPAEQEREAPPADLAPEEPVLAEEATIGEEESVETVTPGREQPPPEEYLTDEIPVAEPPGVEPVEPVAPAAPRPRDVEAAADHFATGLRDSPEEVERELLADLEQPGAQTVRIEPTAPPEPAPSWQEAGARPVEPEAAEAPAPSPERRNLPAAFVSGILLAAAVVALLAIGKGPFAVLAGAIILLGQAEFYAVLRARGHRPATLLGLVAGALLVAGAYLKGEGALLVGLFIATAATALWYMAAAPDKRKGLVAGAGATLLGVAYVPFMASFAMLLLRPAGSVGTTIFLAVVGLTIVYDVFAFAVGSWFGNRPLAPSISPSKTWEGAWGGTFIVLLAGIAIIPSLAPFEGRNAAAVGLALVVAAFAPLGDLVESAFKRDLGVKDMSGLLPGHGGILDRIDAILFTAPAAYLFLRMFL